MDKNIYKIELTTAQGQFAVIERSATWYEVELGLPEVKKEYPRCKIHKITKISTNDNKKLFAEKFFGITREELEIARVKIEENQHISTNQQINNSSALKPHRGNMLLTFGILGCFCCIIFGILAWVMSQNDLKEMAEGRMDPRGESITKIAKIIGIIGCGISIIMCILAFSGALK